MKKLVAIFLAMFFLVGVAMAAGTLELRGTNNDATNLTVYDARLIYAEQFGDVNLKLDTGRANLGTPVIVSSNLIDLTAKKTLLGLVEVKATIGPGQLFETDGTLIDRNYNGCGLGLPLNIDVDYIALVPGIAGDVVADEISISMPVDAQAVKFDVAVYDLRGLTANDIIKVETSTDVNVGPVILGVRGGIADTANKVGATAGFNILDVVECSVAYDAVTGTYTQVGEPIRTTDVLDLPIANDTQVGSIKGVGNAGPVSIVGVLEGNQAGDTLLDAKASVEFLTAQYRTINVGGFTNSFVRLGATYSL